LLVEEYFKPQIGTFINSEYQINKWKVHWKCFQKISMSPQNSESFLQNIGIVGRTYIQHSFKMRLQDGFVLEDHSWHA
jgi:hypothetical protein